MCFRCSMIFPLGALLGGRKALAQRPSTATNDYWAVDAIFSKYCLDCHEAKEPEAKLVLESFDTLMKGGKSGPVVVPGKSSESLLLKLVQDGIERDGKKIIMPPGKRKKLDAEEIAAIEGWIDVGA